MASASKRNGEKLPDSITRISVEGYKSIYARQSIDVRPLTILAGPNSSGKSSLIQPLLLLKQTLEASYDPGALLLNGPNLKFTKAEQLLSKRVNGNATRQFSVEVELNNTQSVSSAFVKEAGKGFVVDQTDYSNADNTMSLKANGLIIGIEKSKKSPEISKDVEMKPVAVRVRCFLKVGFQIYDNTHINNIFHGMLLSTLGQYHILNKVEEHLSSVIHLPGLRGNPLRTYPLSAVGMTFPGTFENYVASVITNWQSEKNSAALESLFQDMEILGLTWKVVAKAVDDTQVEILVGRLPRSAPGGSKDLVSIADVGFGVSQTLPVVVALHAARPGQLVYLEQPEIHLHPRAQWQMAQVLVNAANRGVKVVVETHSHLILLGVQTLIAEGKIDADFVKLHWFQRDKQGATKVTTAEIDSRGSFGAWPEDFGDVTLEAEGRFLRAYHEQPTSEEVGLGQETVKTPRR